MTSIEKLKLYLEKLQRDVFGHKLKVLINLAISVGDKTDSTSAKKFHLTINCHNLFSFDRAPIIITGTEYLTSQGIAHETLWDIWQNVMALGIMAFGIMFLAYVQLRRIKKLK
jgi:hypothetical protein